MPGYGYQRREVTASKIWQVLADHPEGLSRRQIQHHADITPTQFTYGMQLLKRVLTILHERPIAYDPVENIYMLPTDELPMREYVDWSLGRALSVMHTLMQLVEAEQLQHPEVVWPRIIGNTMKYMHGQLAIERERELARVGS